MGRAAHGDVETREVPGDDSSTTALAATLPWSGGDYLTLAPGANFPLISDMRDNKCWLRIIISKTLPLSPELTLLARLGWPGLPEVRTGPSLALTEHQDLPGSALPPGVLPGVVPLLSAVVRGVGPGPV